MGCSAGKSGLSPPCPCPRVQQPHLNSDLPAPGMAAPPLPRAVHTPGLAPPGPAPAPARGPLAVRSPGHSLADEALQTWPQSTADGSNSRKPGPALRMDTVPGSLIELVPCPGGPRLPLGLASGRRACTQTSQPLFVQAKASPPPPGQPALDQWPRAMAGLSGPCPLWPVAPGSMGLPLGSGQHCDCAQVNSPEAGDRQCPPRPALPRPWAPWRLAGRCRRPELSPEACCLVTFLPGYSPWSPRA